jgi:hypothetical protein
MTPFETARAFHRAIPDITPFEEALTAHLLLGLVVSTPSAFLMARPVNLGADDMLFDDVWTTFTNPDCWHVYLAAGNCRALIEATPYPLPYVSFLRKNRLHVRSLKHMTEKVTTISRYGRTTEKTDGCNQAVEQARREIP